MSKNVIQIHIGTYTLYIMAVYDELAILFESYSRKNGFETAHNWPVKATCPYMSMVWLLWTGSSFSFICNDMIPGNLINDRLSHHWQWVPFWSQIELHRPKRKRVKQTSGCADCTEPISSSWSMMLAIICGTGTINAFHASICWYDDSCTRTVASSPFHCIQPNIIRL